MYAGDNEDFDYDDEEEDEEDDEDEEDEDEDDEEATNIKNAEAAIAKLGAAHKKGNLLLVDGKKQIQKVTPVMGKADEEDSDENAEDDDDEDDSEDDSEEDRLDEAFIKVSDVFCLAIYYYLLAFLCHRANYF